MQRHLACKLTADSLSALGLRFGHYQLPNRRANQLFWLIPEQIALCTIHAPDYAACIDIVIGDRRLIKQPMKILVVACSTGRTSIVLWFADHITNDATCDADADQ